MGIIKVKILIQLLTWPDQRVPILPIALLSIMHTIDHTHLFFNVRYNFDQVIGILSNVNNVTLRHILRIKREKFAHRSRCLSLIKFFSQPRRYHAASLGFTVRSLVAGVARGLRIPGKLLLLIILIYLSLLRRIISLASRYSRW